MKEGEQFNMFGKERAEEWSESLQQQLDTLYKVQARLLRNEGENGRKLPEITAGIALKNVNEKIRELLEEHDTNEVTVVEETERREQ